MSILRRKREEDEDELEKLLERIRRDDEGGEGAPKGIVVSIRVEGLEELVKAIEGLTEALKKGGR